MALSNRTKNILVVGLADKKAGNEVATAIDANASEVAEKQDAAFTPTTAGDWSPAPTSVQEALDQLAERVKALEDA